MKAAIGLFIIGAPLTAMAATNVVVGANLTLVASADGTPAPTFQWRKNGANIPGATSASYPIVAATLASAGTYQVVATNSGGFAISADEVLTVTTSETAVLPTIITQLPATQTVEAGASISLSIVAAGVPAPAFQWQKGGVAISGATNSSILLTSVSTNASGTYSVIVSNVAGTIVSRDCTVTVTETSVAAVAPSIVTQPAATQTVQAGSSASFSVGVTGTPSPSIQWMKDGVPISGQTAGTLSLTSAAVTDSGTYMAVASNTAGSVTSAGATLIVTETTAGVIPQITAQPVSQSVTAGAAVEFVVAATGNPFPSFQWKKNGNSIVGATDAKLTFTAVSIVDAGSYTVVAANSSGSTTSTGATLTVQSSPVFTAQPIPQAVNVGATAKFTATVAAMPGATYQWKKNGNSITGATAAFLQINGVSSTDVGLYQLVATNVLGSTTSDEVALSIAETPTIQSQPVDQVVTMKSNVTFSVQAKGSPSPTYQWKKNGVAIAGETKSTLLLKSVNKPDSGEYTVEARNIVGWVVSNRATLTVNSQTGRTAAEEDPGVIADFEMPSTGLVNLSVRANAGTGGNGLIVGFVIDGDASKSVLVRGIGPTLREFGVSSVLADPQLALYSGRTLSVANDDWTSNDNALQIAGMSARLGAFGLAERTSDSALMTTLSHGAYTVQLSGKESSTGMALVEVYDAAASTTTKLVNLSVRTLIGSGSDAPTVGFVVAGTAPRRLLIRAVGPTLSEFGVTDAIADPQLELYRGSVRVEQNDNWGGNPALGTTFAKVGAFGLTNGTSKDSVLLPILEPGAYTVIVSGVNGARGVGLVEVYDAP